MQIRPASTNDSEYIARIRRQNGVREGVLALTSERTEVTEKFISSLGNSDRAYVAEEGGEIIGLAVMLLSRTINRSHCASIAIMVSSDFQNSGVGSALMRQIIGDADKVLKLRRIELKVLADNEPAIKLYKKFGFEQEATLRHAAVKNGKYVDEHLFARINGEAD